MTHERRGQSLVEFALILPVFILLLVGIFDLGRAVYAYNTINNAARQGARLAIVDQTIDHVQDLAAEDAVSLDILESEIEVDYRLLASPDLAGSCDAFVADGFAEAPRGVRRCMAVVKVPYQFEAATPLIGQILGPLELVGRSEFKLEVYCEGPSCPLGE